ncbi:MAG: adenylate/guanylate cyclase domain-containing protein [Actinomycetota bacterium]
MASTGATARKTVTALFCDVTGSTALGEQLDPESLREVIQQYFADMRSVIERHGGTVEKFIGDAVMAVFGVPKVHEDDALRAVRAAADMQGALSSANERFDRDFGVRIQVRIGVNTGEVMAGDPTAQGTFASGDAINVAARLEQAAEPGEVLLGETTYRLVRAAVIAEELLPLPVKGKTEPLTAYRLVVVEAAGQMLPRRFDVPLVGRDAELGALLEAFDAVAGGGACTIVTLVGDAGIGKSRLAHELQKLVENRARVFRGRCLPYGEGITFYPLTEVIQDAAGIGSDDPPDVARTKVAALLPSGEPGLADRLAALLGADEAAGSIQETFLAVRRLLENLAASAPVVVIFDDIQWGEETFLDLLQYIASFVGGRALLIVCLARPQLLEDHPDWTEVGATVRLQPIDAASSEALVASFLGDADSSQDVAKTIIRSAAGNPLFVEEMLRMLVDDGVLTRDGSRWVVTGDVSDVAAPETVQAVIAARLDRLQPEELNVLQCAAVIGEVFWWGGVSALVDDATPAEVGRRLQALARKDLIRPDPSTFFSEDAFRFGHLLIRDVAYEALPKRVRADMHERMARWVAERAAERSAEFDEIIGFHLERAHRYLSEVAPRDERIPGMALGAAERFARAGRRSEDRGDMPAAINLLSRAAELTPADDADRLTLLLDYVEALTSGGRWREADAVLKRTLQDARRDGATVIEWRAQVRIHWLRMHVSMDLDHADALVLGAQAVEVFEMAGDDEGLAIGFNFIGDLRFWLGEVAAAIDLYRRAGAHASRANAPRLEAQTRHFICLALAEGLTPSGDVIAQLEAMLREREGDRVLRAKAARYLGLMYAMRGDFDRARHFEQEGIEIARQLGLDVDLAAGNLRKGAEVADLEGNLERAETYLREAVEILQRIGDRGHLDSVAPDLALVILQTPGREREALEVVALADEAYESDADAKLRWASAKSIALARLGQTEEAEELARLAVSRAWATEYIGLRTISQEALAEVLRATGRFGEAADALERAIEAHEGKGNLVKAERDRRALQELRAAADVSD